MPGVKTLDPVGAGLCVAGMAVLGSSVSLTRLILDYPALTGQALRYALAAAVLAGVLAVTGRSRTRTGAALGGWPHRRGATRSGAAVRGRAGAAGDGGRAGPHNGGRPGRRPTGGELLVLTALAAVGLVAFNACLLVALRHADPAVVGTVVGAAPLGLALLGPALRRRRPAAALVVAAGVVAAGTALVHGSGNADRTGVLAALGALAGEIGFSLLAAVVLPRLGPVRVAAWSCALAVPLLAGLAVAAGEVAHWRLPRAVEAATLGYLALGLTVAAFLAYFGGLRRLGVERAGLFVGLLPVTTLATAAVQDGRWPDPGQAAGVLTVAGGLTLGLLATRRRAAPAGLADV